MKFYLLRFDNRIRFFSMTSVSPASTNWCNGANGPTFAAVSSLVIYVRTEEARYRRNGYLLKAKRKELLVERGLVEGEVIRDNGMDRDSMGRSPQEPVHHFEAKRM